MNFHRFVAVVVPLLLLAVSLPGCVATSVWESNYIGTQWSPLAEGSAVQVRKVPWERVQGTLKDLEAQAAASDVHPEDWSEGKKFEVKGTLLRGLQVSDDAASIEVLGRSNFRTTSPVNPESPDAGGMSEFARKIGATRVAWTSAYLGKADTIVQEPVSAWSRGTAWDSRDEKGRPRSRDYSENSTSWVPVRVQADEYAFVAYFLRDQGR